VTEDARLLNGTLTLHDVRDVEALCRWVVNTRVPGGELRQHEREDLITWLIEVAWFHSRKYRPGGTVSFSTYITVQLRRDVHEWKRKQNGRTRWSASNGKVYERVMPRVVSLEGEQESGELERAWRPGEVDSTDGGLAALARSLLD
jgi:hypothetical protein